MTRYFLRWGIVGIFASLIACQPITGGPDPLDGRRTAREETNEWMFSESARDHARHDAKVRQMEENSQYTP
jgi:hypothetical protein